MSHCCPTPQRDCAASCYGPICKRQVVRQLFPNPPFVEAVHLAQSEWNLFDLEVLSSFKKRSSLLHLDNRLYNIAIVIELASLCVSVFSGAAFGQHTLLAQLWSSTTLIIVQPQMIYDPLPHRSQYDKRTRYSTRDTRRSPHLLQWMAEKSETGGHLQTPGLQLGVLAIITAHHMQGIPGSLAKYVTHVPLMLRATSI